MYMYPYLPGWKYALFRPTCKGVPCSQWQISHTVEILKYLNLSWVINLNKKSGNFLGVQKCPENLYILHYSFNEPVLKLNNPSASAEFYGTQETNCLTVTILDSPTLP